MRRETVLVIDDDATTRAHCRAALERAGLAVTEAADGEAAVRLAARRARLDQTCDLAVVDYLMPGPDGFETFAELRLAQPDLAGILLTGHTSLNVAVDALNRGFSQVVSKPVSPADLVDAVEAALRERHTVQENGRLRALTGLYDSLNELAGLTEPADLHRCAVDLALQQTHSHRVSLMLFDPAARSLRIVAATGLDPQVASAATSAVGEPISGWVFQHGVALELGADKPLPATIRGALRRPEVTASMCLPLCAAGEMLGVLNLSRLASGQGYHRGDIEVASLLAAHAALTIRRLALLREQARRERVATVGRLASTIIHDLRGPVTIISGAAEMLEDSHPHLLDPLGRIRREVGELERMCSQLLSFARSKTGLVLETFLVSDLLRAVLADSRPLARAGVELELGPVVTRVIEAGQAELHRALVDLVVVAAEAAAPGSRVVLGADEVEGGLRVFVDGEAPEARQGWQELDEPTALAAGGAGLTLAILRYLTERHHGQLVVEVCEPAYRIEVVLPHRQPGRWEGESMVA